MKREPAALPWSDEQSAVDVSRRKAIRGFVLATLTASSFFAMAGDAQQPRAEDAPDDTVAWVCPMHSDYTSVSPGKCPLCGMTLVQARPFDFRDFRLEFSTVPAMVHAGEKTTIFLKCYRPGTGEPVTSYTWVHTKQWHLFVISQDMEFFEHIHPVMAPDGTWSIDVVLPKPGCYEVLSDFFPGGGAAQFLAKPLITAGYVGDLVADGAHLVPDTFPSAKTIRDLTAMVSLDPPKLVAGQICRVNFHLTDAKTRQEVTDLQTYLGAFGHALMMSEDMVDYVHVHPMNIVLGSDEDGAPPVILIPPDADLETLRGGPDVTLEASLPRPGHYKVWMQMRRHDDVHTFSVNLNVDPSGQV